MLLLRDRTLGGLSIRFYQQPVVLVDQLPIRLFGELELSLEPVVFAIRDSTDQQGQYTYHNQPAYHELPHDFTSLLFSSLQNS